MRVLQRKCANGIDGEREDHNDDAVKQRHTKNAVCSRQCDSIFCHITLKLVLLCFWSMGWPQEFFPKRGRDKITWSLAQKWQNDVSITSFTAGRQEDDIFGSPRWQRGAPQVAVAAHPGSRTLHADDRALWVINRSFDSSNQLLVGIYSIAVTFCDSFC